MGAMRACLPLVRPLLLAAVLPTFVRSQSADAPPALAREFRAAWVATVDNIDWPSRPGLPTAVARAELDAIVARAAELHLNALVFQVRPAGDAFYESKLEPWSEWLTGIQGKAPDERWDPLQHAITACHRRGLQLHAWFNPYRAWHEAGRSSPARSHILNQLPDACVRYGNFRWMDPGDPRAAKWSLDVIADVVARYDVDGVHLDDYFYPYPQKKTPFPDDRSYERHRRSGGKLSLLDWRRSNVDAFVAELYATVHRTKPWVQVGISPFGIARPGVPRGIAAGVNQYDDLGADVLKWLHDGLVDYMAPQLYWPIDQEKQSFATLLPWWHAENTKQRHVWPGLNVVNILANKGPVRADELTAQIELTRAAARNGGAGHVLYSWKTLRNDDPNGAGALRSRLYGGPVVAPASPWLGDAVPASPAAEFSRRGGGTLHVKWEPDPAVRFVVVQLRGERGWFTHAIVGSEVGDCAIPNGATSVALTAISKTGIASKTVQATAQ